MNYLLDTNTISYLSEQDSPYFEQVSSRLKRTGYDDRFFASILSFYELKHGYFCSQSAENKSRFLGFTNTIETLFSVVPLSLQGADLFGQLKQQYQSQTGITKNAIKRHDIDFMLASTAIAESIVLVSNDHIFENIQLLRDDFQLENWIKS
ncbi:MAG: PIN domain-containing protein [Pseudomonadota bacterium]